MAISCPGAQNHACPNLHMAIWAGQLILVNHRHLNLPSTHYTETCTRITTFNYGSNSVTKQCYKLRTPYPRFTPVKRYSMIHLKKEYFSPLCWLWPRLIFLPAFCTHATLSLHSLCTFAGFLDACPNAFSTVNFSLPVGGRKIQLFATKCRRVHSLSLSRKFRSATKLPYMHTLRLLRVVINLEPQTLESGNRQTCSFRDPYRFNFVIMWLYVLIILWGPGLPAARAVSYIHSYIHRVARFQSLRFPYHMFVEWDLGTRQPSYSEQCSWTI